MTHEKSQIHRGIIEGCTVAAALTYAEHVGLWHIQDKVWVPVRYMLGTAAIGAGVMVASQYLTPKELGRAFWLIAAAASITPVIGRLLRLRKPDKLDSLDHILQEGDSHAVWGPNLRRT